MFFTGSVVYGDISRSFLGISIVILHLRFYGEGGIVFIDGDVVGDFVGLRADRADILPIHLVGDAFHSVGGIDIRLEREG